MLSKEFFNALDEFEQEYQIDRETFISSMESGIASAYKRESGENKEPNDAFHIRMKLNDDKHEIRVYAYKKVIEDDVKPADGDIFLSEAKKIKSSAKIGDEIMTRELQPKQLSRIAVQTAKQVINQRVNTAKQNMIMQEMDKKEGEILPVVIRNVDKNSDTVTVEIMANQVRAIMLKNDQIPTEKYNVGDIIKVYVRGYMKNNAKDNAKTKTDNSLRVSRSNVNFVKKLFESEIPEIRTGDIIIKNAVREAGYRTKIAVSSNDPLIDPVGACIGPKGSRINNIVKQLGGERIDVIQWSPNILSYISNSISPAKPVLVAGKEDYTNLIMTPENKKQVVVTVYVDKDQLSLAIGKEGQNARLAAKLTDAKIDIKPYSLIDDKGDE